MKPITVSVDVPQCPERVFAFLDVMRNHERFTDHMLTDWEYAGPPCGVGSAARVRTNVAGRSDSLVIETVASAPPREIVEHNVGAGGRRHASGTYALRAPAHGRHPRQLRVRLARGRRCPSACWPRSSEP